MLSLAPAQCTARRLALRLLAGLACLLTAPTVAAPDASVSLSAGGAITRTDGERSIAFYYGKPDGLADLRVFERIVVAPQSGADPSTHLSQSGGTSRLYARVFVAKARTLNEIERKVAELWQLGYRGFYMDAAAEDSALLPLARICALIKQHWPEAALITRGGFNQLKALAPHIEAVVGGPLYRRAMHNTGGYVAVTEPERRQALADLRRARTHGLQAISVEAGEPGDREQARRLVRQIATHGVTPFVGNADLSGLGIGTLEVVPRRVLLVHNSQEQVPHLSVAHRFISMPLHYLGYRIDLINARYQHLPATPFEGRYSAVVGIFDEDQPKLLAELTRIYRAALQEKLPLVLLNSFGVPAQSTIGRELGLSIVPKEIQGPVAIETQATYGVGSEIQPHAVSDSLAVRAPVGSTILLGLIDRAGQGFDGVALTPWGGFAIAPYTYVNTSDTGDYRWVIDPITFFEQTMRRNAAFPVPDVTTENGLRLLMVHVDGDGFAARAEISGEPLAADVLYRDFIGHYKIPHTVSVIEAQVSQHGLYPQRAPELEKIAREIFQLDHVEVASNSYSHPFYWGKSVRNASLGRSTHSEKSPEHLPLIGYEFDLQREIDGSVNYINERLAPGNKPTRVFLWSGDADPPASALAAARRKGLLSMNGGDTAITEQHPTLTRVAPLSIRKEGWLHVLAPVQDENAYTNHWTGPYYGFERVVQTFRMTDTPRRLKPINLHYHAYSASKQASITALHRVYQYALEQAVNPVPASDYIRKVHDFESITLARNVLHDNNRQTWYFSGNGALRTLRLPDADARRLNWQESTGIAGQRSGVDGSYLHLSGSHARLVFEMRDQTAPAHVVRANGAVSNFRRDKAQRNSFSFVFTSHVDGELELAHPPRCKVLADGQKLTTTGRLSTVPERQSLATYSYSTKQGHVRHRILVSVRC